MGTCNITADSSFGMDLKMKGFNVYEIQYDLKKNPVYSRKDFYKICLNIGKNNIHYADKSFETNGAVLFFGNPHIPYSWETLTTAYTGYACLFSEAFLKTGERSESLQQSPLFKLGGTPIFNLNDDQSAFVTTLFKKIIDESKTEYTFKADLIRNYIHLIIHEALKMQPSETYSQHKNASFRITAVFIELLERQFPIESVERPLQLKTPQDYATGLSIHVNHLNRAVKQTTGKSTTMHIAERIITEAKALLKHTNWSSAEIAYSLGFEYPTYFNNYFKRLTGASPSAHRLADV